MAQSVTEEELNQAKNKVLARSVLRSERPMGRLASLGFNWAYRRTYLSVEDELEAFSRVTLSDIRRVLADWPLWPMTIVCVGPSSQVCQPR
jgi:predicted Zn-dependent peptidase